MGIERIRDAYRASAAALVLFAFTVSGTVADIVLSDGALSVTIDENAAYTIDGVNFDGHELLSTYGWNGSVWRRQLPAFGLGLGTPRVASSKS